MENIKERVREMLKQRIAVLDVETTGLNARYHKIVEISIIGKGKVSLLSTLVNPCVHISDDVSKIHGIRDHMVRDAPKMHDLLPKIHEILKEIDIVFAYNVHFDKGFIAAAGVDTDLCKWQCAKKLFQEYRRVFMWRKGNISLGNACRETGITLTVAHRAENDTAVTLELLEYMAQDH